MNAAAAAAWRVSRAKPAPATDCPDSTDIKLYAPRFLHWDYVLLLSEQGKAGGLFDALAGSGPRGGCVCPLGAICCSGLDENMFTLGAETRAYSCVMRRGGDGQENTAHGPGLCWGPVWGSDLALQLNDRR